MPRVAVVTDTTQYLPRELLERHGIREVSLYVNWGAEQQREADLPSFDGFYERLRTSGSLPTTSQPSVGDFLEAYEPLIEAGQDIVSIHLAAGISGTCASAQQAADELAARGQRGRVAVIDSRRACGGLGMVVLAAAAVASSGAELKAVVQRAEAARAASKIWFAIDTLEYLRRGGRIGAASAWLGSALRIKPILTVEGEITPVERVRTSARALQRMVDYLRARRDDGATVWAVQHIQAPEQIERLVAAGRELFGSEPLFRSEIGPVIGTHLGPGMLGATGLDPALLETAV